MKLETKTPVRTGWSTKLTHLSLAALILLAATGLVITFAPFHAAVEWTVILHTVLGLLVLIPVLYATLRRIPSPPRGG